MTPKTFSSDPASRSSETNSSDPASRSSGNRPAASDGGEIVRNVVLVGPGAAGKTILTEAVLAATGAVTRPGSVENGNTVSDFEDVERRMGRSVSLAVASTLVQDPEVLPPDASAIRLNLVDTPGHADFVGDLRAGLRAADAALFVISASEMTAGERASTAAPACSGRSAPTSGCPGPSW